MDLGIRGKVAFVAGGSGGIGKVIALLLAEEGVRLAISARRADALEATAAEIMLAVPSADVFSVPADLSQPGEAERAVESVLHRWGPVSILANAAGKGVRGTFEQTDRDLALDALDASLMTAVQLSRAVAPGMKDAGWGRIVHVAAVSGRQPTAGQMPSNIAKAAVISFAKSASVELAKYGVTMNTVLPGRIMTGRVAGNFTPEQVREREAAIPMGRYGSPEEFAAAVVFLCSAQASYITGTALAVDGGLVQSIF